MRQQGLAFDVAFRSVLKRAIRTLWIVLAEMDLMWLPVHRDWRLNERHYGALQGLDKGETAARHGQEQVMAWRRRRDARPPVLREAVEACAALVHWRGATIVVHCRTGPQAGRADGRANVLPPEAPSGLWARLVVRHWVECMRRRAGAARRGGKGNPGCAARRGPPTKPVAQPCERTTS